MSLETDAVLLWTMWFDSGRSGRSGRSGTGVVRGLCSANVTSGKVVRADIFAEVVAG